jgi:hypothetical protein
MTPEEYAGPMPEVKGDDDYAEYDKWRKKIRERDKMVQKAVAEGLIEPEEADRNKVRLDGVHVDKIVQLPSTLYHTTTAKDKAITEGLKSREELSMSEGSGLGGGASNTISFTADLNVAINIKRAILEAREVSAGRLTIQQMIDQAEKGEGAKHSWLYDVLGYYRQQDSRSDQESVGKWGIPMQIQLLMKGETKKFEMFPTDDNIEKWVKEGWYNDPADNSKFLFRRKLSREDLIDRTFQFFKTWSMYRQNAGGPEDPLFFSSNVLGLANIDPGQVAVLEYRAKPGAKGHQLHALGEWRAWSGKGLEFVRVVA